MLLFGLSFGNLPMPYASAVESLMYAMVCTRLDLAKAASVVSMYMGKIGKEHWKAVKQIWRYLKGTTNIGLIYQGNTSCTLVGYSDSNYTIDLDARRSVIGYAFTIGNSLVSWKATPQPIVALLTAKAEYMALVEATK